MKKIVLDEIELRLEHATPELWVPVGTFRGSSITTVSELKHSGPPDLEKICGPFRNGDDAKLAALLRNYAEDLVKSARLLSISVTPCQEATAVGTAISHWQDKAGRLEMALTEMRETFPHDPEHDSDTVNWALGIFDDAMSGLWDQDDCSAKETSPSGGEELRR